MKLTTKLTGIVGIAMVWAFTTQAAGSFSQVNDDKPAMLLVGTIEAPPFAMKTADGVWVGLSVDLWQAVASLLGVQYEMRKYGTMEQVLDAVESEKVDVAIALAATAKREITLDLSHSYYRSGSAIAVSKGSAGFGWTGIVGRLDISRIFSMVGLLALLWLMAGTTVWIFERRRNRGMFGGGFIRGIGHAVWWAAVTMTTVGYGDKTPRTPAGRIVAVVWMLTSIVLIAGFTASISASLTAEKLIGKVRDHHDLPAILILAFSFM